ncbi:MAG: hypothetical protein ABL901_20415, partial [Hyphomicrobiaceae bacterium]
QIQPLHCTRLHPIHRDTSFRGIWPSGTLKRPFAWQFSAVRYRVGASVSPEDLPAEETTNTGQTESGADARLQSAQIQRALASIRALAIVLARQAAREDDATERKAADSEADPHDLHDGSIISDGG